jgi:hypothetical protein
MRIMEKQETNRVSTVKLRDCQHTETGKETLNELSRVHFEDSYDDGQGQQNLGICESITNKGDWNLAKRVISQ